jgi:hypothetical protein
MLASARLAATKSYSCPENLFKFHNFRFCGARKISAGILCILSVVVVQSF